MGSRQGLYRQILNDEASEALGGFTAYKERARDTTPGTSNADWQSAYSMRASPRVPTTARATYPLPHRRGQATSPASPGKQQSPSASTEERPVS